MKGLFSVAAVAVILHSAGYAHAVEETSEPTPAQVRSAAEAFDRGREAYKADEFVEAAEQFESADANAPSAAALELAIRARDKAGQLDRAGTLAALALTRHRDDPTIQKIAPAIVQRAKAELFELEAKCSEPCDLTVGGKIAPGRRATEHTLYLAPGTYVVRAGWSEDRSLSKSIEAVRGANGSIDFQTPAAAAPSVAANPPLAANSAEPPSDAGTAQHARGLPQGVFWVGVGLTAVLGGVSIWSGVDTQNNPGPDKVRDACQARREDCMTLYQQGVDNQQRTNVLLGVTAGLGVATAVVGVFFTDFGGTKADGKRAERGPAPRRAAVTLEPLFSIGSGASVGALGRF